MIQLYKSDNTNYDYNGNFIIHPESCDLEAELNGAWTLTIVYPRIDDDEVFNEIKADAVIKTDTWLDEAQLFRIYNIDKTDDDVTAYARPIFFDAKNETMLLDARPTNCTGQVALDKMCAGTRYSGESDIKDIATAYYARKNLIEAISSSDENSFLSRWKGEILYDNYKIIINKAAGQDRGASVRFGKNMTAVEQDISYDDIATRIIPVAYNGYMLDGQSPWVDSEYINKYATVHTKVIEYSDIKLAEDTTSSDETGYANILMLREALKKRCKEEFDAGIDLPAITYRVDLVELSQYEEYKDVKDLEKIFLGDTVLCENDNLNISTKAKAIKITYDCINQCNTNVTLGDYEANFLDDMSSNVKTMLNNIDEAGNVKGESIAGLIDLMQTKLKASREIAKKQIERAILFEDNDPDSSTFGAMSLGTTGFQIASEKNSSGDWIWTTFGTGEGFVANCIIAGILYSQNYVENKQGVKIDLNAGLIEAFNLAWKAAYSQMTADGKLTVKDIIINGGSFNINDMFKVSKDGKLSWNASKSKMSEDGAMECSSFKMTGGSIHVEAASSVENILEFKYGENTIKITPSGIRISDNKYQLELINHTVMIFDKSTNTVASISGTGINYTDGKTVKINLNANGVEVSSYSSADKKTILTPGAVKLQDGSKINIITASSELG
jgi:phage minor structural protein